MLRLLLLAVLLLVSPSLRAAGPDTFDVGGITFKRPADWEWIDVSSPMRKAQLKVKGKDGATADVTFFHFGKDQGGDVDSNVHRWISQFEGGKDEIDPNVETREINGLKVTFVRHEGTFMSGMPGGPSKPMAGYALAGAIIEGPKGNVFIKMTGPEAVVKEHTAGFEEMVSDIVLAE